MLAQLEATRLLARVDGVVSSMQGVRSSLACRPAAAGGFLGAGVASFASLPHAVALAIFVEVPADQRARLALVCRAWRDTMADPAAWERLDLSVFTSDFAVDITDATLRAAAARANGRLSELYLDDCVELTPAVRLEVVAANAGSLRKLRLLCTDEDDYDFDPLPFREQEALARAAPHLTELRADAKATVEQATVMLRNDAPFEALKLLRLEVVLAAEEDRADAAAVYTLAAALPCHQSLKMLRLEGLDLHTPAVLDAVCAAVADLEVSHVLLRECGLGPDSVPTLVRLLGGKLQRMIVNNYVQLFDEAAGVLFAGAFATSRLTQLSLIVVDFWNDAAAARAVLHAVTGHPTLQSFDVSFNEPADAAAAGLALGVLVAANAPSLTCLNVWHSFFGDVGLGPLMEALPHNTHLRALDCYNTGMSDDFARIRFLPAVRANTSLRDLSVTTVSIGWDENANNRQSAEVLEAQALVSARATADAQ